MKSHILLFLIIGTTYSYADWAPDFDSDMKDFDHEIDDSDHAIEDFDREMEDLYREMKDFDREIEDFDREMKDFDREMEEDMKHLGAGEVILSTKTSGILPNGDPCVHTVEVRQNGDILHHSETVYNQKTGEKGTYNYDIDLKDPNARPVPVDVPEGTNVPVQMKIRDRGQSVISGIWEALEMLNTATKYPINFGGQAEADDPESDEKYKEAGAAGIEVVPELHHVNRPAPDSQEIEWNTKTVF